MFVTSQYGKNCIAVSQDEVAAQMMGVNLLKTKLTALFISAFYAGVAGGLLASILLISAHPFSPSPNHPTCWRRWSLAASNP